MTNRSIAIPLAALMLGLAGSPPSLADTQPEALRRFDEPVRRAVDEGLEWLAQSFDADRGFPGQHGSTSAIPALAAMAFLSAGHTPGNGPHGEVINQCIDYVLESEKEKNGRPSGVLIRRNGRMYAHCISTLMLSEVSGMVDPQRQQRVDDTLARALNVILAAQQVKKRDQRQQGGWRYSPDSSDSDMSVTGWALMALRSARINGAPVPRQAIDEAIDYTQRSFDEKSGGFEYQVGRGSVRYPLSGAAILCLELTGHHRSDMTLKGGDYIMKPLRGGGFISGSHYHYGLYYCSQAMFQLGDDYWVPFAEKMYQETLKRQKDNGSWGNSGYETSMSILALTVAYRQLPIYQR